MTYRFYKVTAIVAVEQYEAQDLCDEHRLVIRTGIDGVQMLDDDDVLIDITEEELVLTPKVADALQGAFARLRSEVK